MMKEYKLFSKYLHLLADILKNVHSQKGLHLLIVQAVMTDHDFRWDC